MQLHHHCELTTTSNTAFPTLPPDSPRWVIWFRKLRIFCSVTGENPQCRYHIISLAALAHERRRQARMPQWWIIHPFSNARFTWEIVMLFVYSVALFSIPLIICFNVLDHKTTHLDEVNLYLYFFCWLDIIMNCITGIYCREKIEVILDPREILKHYLKTFLLLDIFTSIPYDRITMPWRTLPDNDLSIVIAFVNLIPVLKIFRFVTIITYIRRLCMYLQIDELGLQMTNTLVLSIYLIHWLACMCFVVPMLVMIGFEEQTCGGCWLELINSTSTSDRYQYALLMAVNNLTASSFGIYEPRQQAHAIVCIFLMITGRFFETYVIVMILEIKMGMQASQMKYAEIMNQLSAYMSHKQLPAYMRRRLHAYYHYRFLNSYFREKLILSTLSGYLRQEIILHSCRRLVENVAIFKSLPRQVLGSIVTNLKLELFLPNDLIVKAGTQGDCMFFLASGTVAVLTPTGKEVCHLEDGSHFGEVALLVQDQRRVASVVAIEVCEVYRLERRDFRRCIAVHSDLFAKIERIATDRMERTVLLEEQHKRFLLQRGSRMSTITPTKRLRRPYTGN